jgi:hypothetical protein
MKVERAGILRTARKIMQGEVFVPENVWPKAKAERELTSAL